MVIMYASLFSYEPAERMKMLNYKVDPQTIAKYQQSGNALPANSAEVI